MRGGALCGHERGCHTAGHRKCHCLLAFFSHRYKELVNKKRIITNDKQKIESVISDLDEKKNEARAPEPL